MSSTGNAINPLTFQYQLRSYNMNQLSPEERLMADEQRDRELEDYLGTLDERTAAAATAAASVLAGTNTLAFVGTNVEFVDVTFDVSFVVQPVVVTSTNDTNYIAAASSRTTTGFRLTIRRIDGTNVNASILADWIARG